ncbi:MAG: beta-propeller domain-containing protein [Clostridia bacterium]|nr:beta-propeller domain-containing protein [Clostridia bacterium]
MKKKTIISLSIVSFLVLALIVTLCTIASHKENEIEGFKRLKGDYELNEFLNNGDYKDYSAREKFINILTLPISLGSGGYYYRGGGMKYVTNGFDENIVYEAEMDTVDMNMKSFDAGTKEVSVTSEKLASEETGTSDIDYSKTNIQVVNVDEADRIKTDGKFIYTINNEVVNIVDASNASSIKDVKKIEFEDAVPVDIMLNEKSNKLVVIGSTMKSYDNNTIVNIYDINDDFKLLQSSIYQYNYVTSRMIEDRVIVITNGYTYDRSNFEPIYKIDDENFTIDSKNIFVNQKYFENGFTYVASIDLSSNTQNVYGLTLNTNQVYVSEDNIYLIKDYYDCANEEDINIGCIFTFKGIFGASDMYDYSSYRERTKVVKLSLDKKNEIDVKAVKSLEGRIINQFSFDEKDGYLRIALDKLGDDHDECGAVILDKNLNIVDHMDGLAKAESIYAARFTGDRLYLVTYRNMDPLFVISLKNNKIKVLGELKIPGYSTYLHPYDNDHLIGIGVDTKENVFYDDFGRVVSTSADTLGLKMALFDVSDVTSPKEISKVTIGDEYTTSNILTNHKALLFSKEKELLAIPVKQNKAWVKHEVSFSGEDIGSITSAYSNLYDNNVTSDNGFAVYSINLNDGIKLKGYVFHENTYKEGDYRYYYRYNSVPVRGLYIKDNLFTISDDYIKVNKLSNLQLVSKFNLK